MEDNDKKRRGRSLSLLPRRQSHWKVWSYQVYTTIKSFIAWLRTIIAEETNTYSIQKTFWYSLYIPKKINVLLIQPCPLLSANGQYFLCPYRFVQSVNKFSKWPSRPFLKTCIASRFYFAALAAKKVPLFSEAEWKRCDFLVITRQFSLFLKLEYIFVQLGLLEREIAKSFCGFLKVVAIFFFGKL